MAKKRAKKFDGIAQHDSGGSSVSRLSSWKVIDVLSESFTCEHCKVYRPRKISYQIQNKAGRKMIVGSSCVNLFVTASASDAALKLKIETSLQARIADESHHMDMIANPDATLAHAMCHLYKISEEYTFSSYGLAINALQTARDGL